MLENEWIELRSAATAARVNADGQINQLRTGVAIRTVMGSCIVGFTIAGAWRGGTMCAERVALVNLAMSGKELATVEAVFLVTGYSADPDEFSPAPPCEACRQLLAESCSNAEVSFIGEQGRTTKRARELLSEPVGLY